ncbi:MAG: RNA-binding S4 domain-containing protein [Deltaproteobacteria bacterium]|nr:RNA-binding S4 domain-containing protein [Deltaproteobacteria bacterium]
MTNEPASTAGIRIDKWLWAARIWKTRGLASKACDAGHVTVAGVSVKPSRLVRLGDRIEAVTPGGVKILEVRGLSEQRGPATVARTLYEDHSPPPPPREAFVPVALRERGAGRPTKRDRRVLGKLRGD